MFGVIIVLTDRDSINFELYATQSFLMTNPIGKAGVGFLSSVDQS